MARVERPVFHDLDSAKGWARSTLAQLKKPPFTTPEYKENIVGRINDLISEYETWPDLGTANMWITFAFEEFKEEKIKWMFLPPPEHRASTSRLDTILEAEEGETDDTLEQEAKADAPDDTTNTVPPQVSRQIAAAISGVTLADNFNQPTETEKQEPPLDELEQEINGLRKWCLNILNKTEGKKFKERDNSLSRFIEHIRTLAQIPI